AGHRCRRRCCRKTSGRRPRSTLWAASAQAPEAMRVRSGDAFEARLETFRGVRSYEHAKSSRLDHRLHVESIEREIFESDSQLDGARFTRFQGDALETLEL